MIGPRSPAADLPLWARSVMLLAPLGDRRSDVEADLAELFGDRRNRYGTVYAHRRLCTDVFSLWRGTLRGGSMLRDVRFGLRLLRRHPLPIGVTLAGLALAIGVVTSVFTIVNAVMLKPFGMDDPPSVVTVNHRTGDGMWAYWPYSHFMHMHDASKLAAVEAMMLERVRFSAAPAGDADLERQILFVSGSYLETFGGRPAIGRTLQPSDDVAGAPAVTVVSHHFWTTHLNSDANVAGKTIWLSGSPVTVVGVLRPGFTGPTTFRPAFWATFGAYDDVLLGRAFTRETRSMIQVYGRVAPGVSTSAAEDHLTALMTALVPPGTTPGHTTDPRVFLYRAASPIDGPDAAESYLALGCIFAVVGLVLALACANTANLLLAGAATRSREIGVRLALGSTRGRLIRQLLAESLLLAAIAAGFGLIFATWFAPVLGSIIQLPPEFQSGFDVRVLLFTIGVAIACGVGAGISPARYGAHGDVLSALNTQGGSGAQAVVRSRLRTSFVLFQSAVSMLLLVSAALLARTALVMTRTDVGFDADRMLGVSFSAPRTGFDEHAYFAAAVAAVRGLPGVESVSLTQYQPFGYSVESQVTRDSLSYTLYVNRVDAAFVPTAGLRVVRGRVFTPEEVAREEPVVLISEDVARIFFRGANPIGQPVPELWKDLDTPGVVIGVVADAMLTRIRTHSFGTIYRPIHRKRSNPPAMIVRAARPGSVARSVEDALRRIDSRVRVTSANVRHELDAYLANRSMLAWLAGPIALLALVLAVLGVYGVTAFVVSQRTKEVSVRMAIGASSADVVRLLMRDSLRPVAIGLVIGLAGALVVSRIFESHLPGVSPHDPVAIAMAMATLLAGALVAIAGPARRVAKTDPAVVLRQT